jgi:hypothetical protein
MGVGVGVGGVGFGISLRGWSFVATIHCIAERL